MFNIVIPIIMVFIFIIFYNKNLNETLINDNKNLNETLINDNKNLNETFENTLSPSETRKKEKIDKRSNFLTFIENKKKKYKIELIQLNPFFEKTKLEIKDILDEKGDTIKANGLQNVENIDWKPDFKNRLCEGCQCTNPDKYMVKKNTHISPSFNSPSPSFNSPSPSFNSPSPSFNSPSPSFNSPSPSFNISSSNKEKLDNTNWEEKHIIVCGYNDEKNNYQCSSKCSQCNLCHSDVNEMENKYLNKCNNETEASNKELCLFFNDRVKYVKDNCVFPLEIKDLKLNDKECFSFKRKNDNRYVKNDIIIFRITSLEKTEKIELKNIYYKSDKYTSSLLPIEFFLDKNELYFFIKTDNLKNFNNEILININFNMIKNGITYKNREIIKINIENFLDYLPKYDEKLAFKTKTHEGTLPASFDEYNLNYLEESKFKNKQLVNGYSVINKVEDYILGEFKEYTFKDSPNTWKLRVDINRPWISLG